MDKKNIRTIDLSDFSRQNYIMDYIDDEIAVINSIKDLPYNNENVRLNCYLMIFCLEGRIQIDINNVTYQLDSNDFLLGLPNTILSNIMLSPKHNIRIAVFSTSFVQQIIKMEQKTWNAAIQIHNRPINPLQENKANSIYNLYEQLILHRIKNKTHCYQKNVIHYLFSALFCEMLGTLTSRQSASPLKTTDRDNKKKHQQASQTLLSFLQILSEDNGVHRSVSYYANMLCYTPKHFSILIKQASGKLPSELINESVIACIKYYLKHSDKSIKEISEMFQFPNQSFFGKFVKTHLGITPMQYRLSQSNE